MKMYHLVEAESLWALSQRGSVNLPQVKELQDKLRAAGHDPGPSDGWYGKNTADAVRAYQQANGLTVDGDAGPETLGKLGMAGANNTPPRETPPEETPPAPAPRQTATEPRDQPAAPVSTQREPEQTTTRREPEQTIVAPQPTKNEPKPASSYNEEELEREYTDWFNNHTETLSNGIKWNAFSVIGSVNLWGQQGDTPDDNIAVNLTVNPTKLKKLTKDKNMIAFWQAVWDDDEEAAIAALQAGSGAKVYRLDVMAVTSETTRLLEPLLRRYWRAFVNENDIKPGIEIAIKVTGRYDDDLQFAYYSRKVYNESFERLSTLAGL